MSAYVIPDGGLGTPARVAADGNVGAEPSMRLRMNVCPCNAVRVSRSGWHASQAADPTYVAPPLVGSVVLLNTGPGGGAGQLAMSPTARRTSAQAGILVSVDGTRNISRSSPGGAHWRGPADCGPDCPARCPAETDPCNADCD